MSSSGAISILSWKTVVLQYHLAVFYTGLLKVSITMLLHSWYPDLKWHLSLSHQKPHNTPQPLTTTITLHQRKKNLCVTEHLPCVQLAPDPLSVHTSWQAYSSPPSGPRCSPAHRWGAPWWPARPHLDVGRGWEKGWEASRRAEGEKAHCGTTLALLSLRWLSHTTQNTQRKRYAGELSMNPPKRLLYGVCQQCCFCSLFLSTLCCYFQNDKATPTRGLWCSKYNIFIMAI